MVYRIGLSLVSESSVLVDRVERQPQALFGSRLLPSRKLLGVLAFGQAIGQHLDRVDDLLLGMVGRDEESDP